ncbi:MAG: hypothetical protein IJU57_07160 [Clostridia bacterium]|nr:hypothetical protein [Clostridia bacterium]
MWYGTKGNDSDVAISTRVRIARNLAGYPFGDRLDDAKKKEIIEKIDKAFKGKEWKYTDMSSLTEAQRQSLADRHLISREFAGCPAGTQLIQNKDQDVNVMVLEEDHVRIQSIVPGFDIRSAMEKAEAAEAKLDEACDIAYSEKYGYITHCPTNLGTGIRISVMLHLPAYTRAGGIKALALQLAKLGLTIRGADGEGSDPSGNIYQISNQVTLGVTEDELVERLSNVVGNIIKEERSFHEKAGEEFRSDLRENARRNFGILMFSERISSREITDMYSTLRLAASSGLIKLPQEKLDELLVRSMPSTVEAEHKGVTTPEARDRARAELAREILGESAI